MIDQLDPEEIIEESTASLSLLLQRDRQSRNETEKEKETETESETENSGNRRSLFLQSRLFTKRMDELENVLDEEDPKKLSNESLKLGNQGKRRILTKELTQIINFSENPIHDRVRNITVIQVKICFHSF